MTDTLATLKKFGDLAVACNRCGFCTSYCPTYLATGNESYSPRGRNQMFRAMVEGKLANDQEARSAIDTCLLCGECTVVCFAEVPTATLMIMARQHLSRTTGQSRVLLWFLQHILPHAARLRWVLKISFLIKRSGFVTLLRRWASLDRWAPALAAGDALANEVPLKFLLDYPQAQRRSSVQQARQRHGEALERQRSGQGGAPLTGAKVALMPACGTQYARPAMGLATLTILNELKIDYEIPVLSCCGLPANTYGELALAADIARRNIEILERGHFETVLVDDASCGIHVREWARLLESDPKWMKRAHEMALRVSDWPTYLVQRGLKDLLRRGSWSGGAVAYHDPCKAQHGARLVGAPRELLAAVPGLKLVPIPEADQCCGGGGTYNMAQPELSQGVLSAKIRNIEASGADWVVSSNSSCLMQIESGLRKKGSTIRILHLNEFLERVLKNEKR